MLKRLPIGVEDFEKLRQNDFYYVDKTGLIKELTDNLGDVNLFTRPRRFGKSLNMSMFRHFFEIGGDKSIFEGLKISQEKKTVEDYMGKFPVISISLKGVDARSFQSAKIMLAFIISEAARKISFLLDSEKLEEGEKEELLRICEKDANEEVLAFSLRTMTKLLCKHYGKRVVVLIDEYDVPLAKAYAQGFYDEMVSLIRNFLGNVLKTNENLQFAVLTGCLRIAKESIFTGLNNFKVFSIMDVVLDEYFGFTDEETKEMLHYYGLDDYYGTIRDWYDGYRFGNVDVYCPWDVLNYCAKVRYDPELPPENYWINTSSNDAVEKFINESGTGSTKREIERLVAGETIVKTVHPELTYKDMYKTIDNLWSLLFMTGYLTQRKRIDGKTFELAIPNMEIRDIFVTQIMEFFRENVRKNGETLNRFCEALRNAEAEKVGEYFSDYLKKTISIRDTFVRRPLKENFYHGILVGILGVKEGWSVSSNREAGDGYSDIIVDTEESETAMIIEVKYAEDGNLDAACEKALAQIEDTHYEEELVDDGIPRILKYGIACYKKRCKVLVTEMLVD